MSIFVVHFVDSRSGRCRGRVRHVRSGEEASFASARDLLVFFETMNAVREAADDALDAGGRSDDPDPVPGAEREGNR